MRRYRHGVEGWERVLEDSGSHFDHDEAWLFDKDYAGNEPCNAYYGPVAGDSGGALIEDATGRLCGVDSSTELPAAGLSPSTYWVTNRYAGIDSNLNSSGNPLFSGGAAWVLQQTIHGHGILDPKGWWEGECPNATHACEDWGDCDDTDTDGDGVIDACDDCIFVHNPEQLTEDDDPDHNHHGAACDVCPGRSYDQDVLKGNGNGEVELAVYDDEATRTPVLPIGLDFFARQTRYLDTFRPRVCDAAPTPNGALTSQPGGLPDASLPAIIPCAIPSPNCNCPVVNGVSATCAWDIQNRVELKPLSGGAPGAPQGGDVWVGMRYCPCVGFDTTTLAGRAGCRSSGQCPAPEEADYLGVGPLNPWRRIGTQPSSLPAQDHPAPGTEYAVPIGGHLDLVWQFLDLGSDLDTFTDGGGHPVRFAPKPGMLWFSLRSVPPGVSGQRVARFGHTYAPANASAELRVQGPTQILASDIEWHIAKFCPGCPEGATRLRALPNDPLMYAATETGLAPDRAVAQGTRELYAAFAAGVLRFVPASEPLGRLNDQKRPGGRLLRGVALDGTVTVRRS
ncbi:MAG: hypothetical protein HY908_10150 [Myxococcales bacterium]|nr:hypothetical protein [Myxococcales bacterium]